MSPALQISIPTASTATPADSKAYTQYHIALQLPLRKLEIKKRYNDFLQLHDTLISQTSQAPPSPLPAKSWLRRTVNNSALTEERRAGLEKYLQSILSAEDPKWRSSSAWRSFLNLPSGTTTTTTSNGRPGSSTTTAISDPNQWLDVHRELKSQIQSARSLLKQREAATTAQTQHTLSAEAKGGLVRAATSIAMLEDGLGRIMNGSKKLGEGELRRRRDLVGAAKKEVEGLEGVLRSMATKNTAPSAGIGAVATQGDKEALWKGTTTANGAARSGRVLGGPAKETERTRELDNSGVLQLQKQVMQEQDEDVLSLGKTVARLKDMGIMINEELSLQSEMLGLVEEDVDRVQGKIDIGRRRIGKIS